MSQSPLGKRKNADFGLSVNESPLGKRKNADFGLSVNESPLGKRERQNADVHLINYSSDNTHPASITSGIFPLNRQPVNYGVSVVPPPANKNDNPEKGGRQRKSNKRKSHKRKSHKRKSSKSKTYKKKSNRSVKRR